MAQHSTSQGRAPDAPDSAGRAGSDSQVSGSTATAPQCAAAAPTGKPRACASATFTVLGVGIAAIFGATQLNALANNAWLNVAIGLVFVAFAFNMLGMFEIRIPSGLLTFTSHQEAAGGYLGAAFMALTFTLTSFTCTFAFAGSLLVAAAQGQYYWPILGMMAFGTAFASPFFVLALVPSMLKKLPKSGGWMNSVKVVMGLIEIGAAVKFFSVADLQWNNVPVVFDFVGAMVAWLSCWKPASAKGIT